MAPSRTAANGTAAWRVQVLVAHGIRALREAQSLAVQLLSEADPGATEHIQALLTAAVEQAQDAYRALIRMDGE